MARDLKTEQKYKEKVKQEDLNSLVSQKFMILKSEHLWIVERKGMRRVSLN